MNKIRNKRMRKRVKEESPNGEIKNSSVSLYEHLRRTEKYQYTGKILKMVEKNKRQMVIQNRRECSDEKGRY